MDYEIVIGLEVHSELKTKSKVFCSCENGFGGKPNTRCCPVCSGHPGTLPVLNRTAVDYTVKAGLALNCEIETFSKFDRKNYYYPDLPKAYQISQFPLPLCKNGRLDFTVDGVKKSVRINRIHLEEDAGKLVHSEWGEGTLVDYNRCGVPLIEIVTEPDMRSPEEALAFLENLKSILKYTGVSDCKMEQGSIRCDVNLSLRKPGAKEFGVRSEMKNVNSFKAAYRAMVYEAKRQAEILDRGGVVEQETRRWDDAKGKSFVMRTKEDAHDYRYFPEPDLVPVVLAPERVEEIRAELPELPAVRKVRYETEFGLPAYDAEVLTADRGLADFFEETVELYDKPKTVSNWIMGEVLRKCKETESEEISVPFSAKNFAKLLEIYEKQVVNQAGAKKIFEMLWTKDEDPEEIVEREGLRQVDDSDAIRKAILEIIAANPRPVADYKAGNKKAVAFFVGQVMKATKGKANPQTVNKILAEELEK